MRMEEYMEKLISQIRCKKARPYIESEIKDHIEEQIAFNKSKGMSDEEAEKNAVMDMGDPIEVGISMDKIHKPQLSLRLLAVVGILSVFGIMVQCSIFQAMNLQPQGQGTYGQDLAGFVTSIILGLTIMCGIYFIDYTVIAKYAKIIGLLILFAGITFLTGLFGESISGPYYFLGFRRLRFSVSALMMLYVPIYGGILYKYRDGGKKAFFKAILWMIVPIVITFRMPNFVVAGILLISMLVLLTASLIKGWFQMSVKRTIVCLWAGFMVLPMVMLFVMYGCHLLADYQVARIRSFYLASGDGFYMTSMLRTLCENIPWIGNSGKDVVGSLPEFHTDYIFSYILNSYGSIVGMVVIAMLAVLVMVIFGAAIKQKNELGMMIGFGCGMIFLLNILINLLCTMGVIPPASAFLPFFSVGKSNSILSYALIGMVMSIYRYKDVYPRNVADKVRLKKSLDINL